MHPPPDQDLRPRYVSGESDYLFAEDTLHTFSLILSEADLAFLDADPTAEKYIEGSLTFEGETVASVGVRYKGSWGAWQHCIEGPGLSGAKTCTKLSIKVKINYENRNESFYGLRKLQFHSMNRDSSMMRERLGYWVFREMGVPAPRAVHARVELNGTYLGLFALVEQIDGRFTRSVFEDGTGNLYKEVWPITSSGSISEPDDLIDGLKTNKSDEHDNLLILSFAKNFLAADEVERRTLFATYLDIDEMAAYAAVDVAIVNQDGVLDWRCPDTCASHNFYWYENPSSGQLHLIPWDLDTVFPKVGTMLVADGWGDISSNCEPFESLNRSSPQRSAACDPLVATWASFTDEYATARAALLAGPLAPATVEANLAEWSALIEASVVEAATAHDDAVSPDQWRATVAEMSEGVPSNAVSQ